MKSGIHYSYLNVQLDGKSFTQIMAVAVDIGEVVGTIQVGAIRNAARLFVTGFQQLFVHPDWRGQRIGSGLVAQCEKLAKAAGFQALSLIVQKRNCRAQELYRKLGYTESYEDDEEFTMTKRL
jgi:ribosomal protein S18 acetylase RimI-like enzyme